MGSDLDDAVGSLHGFGFAEKLVAEAFDVVHPIGNDDGVAVQRPLDGRVERSTSIFLCSRGGVDVAVESKRVVVDVEEFQALDARLCGLGYATLEVADELVAAVGFAGFGIAGEQEELLCDTLGARIRGSILASLGGVGGGCGFARLRTGMVWLGAGSEVSSFHLETASCGRESLG